MEPVLARPIDASTLVGLVNDPAWVMSQKLDGTRCLIEMDKGVVRAFNRQGVQRSLPAIISDVLRPSLRSATWVLDGELLRLGDRNYQYVMFDLIQAGDLVGPRTPFIERLDALEHVAREAGWHDQKALATLVYARDTDAKSRLVRRLHEAHAEGVIARLAAAPYDAGRRSPSVLKFKFVKQADCVVVARGKDGKANMTLAVYRDGALVEVADCTALAGDGSACTVGSVVTVTYLGLSDSGRLIQPTLPTPRSDKSPSECTWDQLVPMSKEVINAHT